jgi:hypothetical protein
LEWFVKKVFTGMEEKKDGAGGMRLDVQVGNVKKSHGVVSNSGGATSNRRADEW